LFHHRHLIVGIVYGSCAHGHQDNDRKPVPYGSPPLRNGGKCPICPKFGVALHILQANFLYVAFAAAFLVNVCVLPSLSRSSFDPHFFPSFSARNLRLSTIQVSNKKS
jgi:hypothetical protein